MRTSSSSSLPADLDGQTLLGVARRRHQLLAREHHEDRRRHQGHDALVDRQPARRETLEVGAGLGDQHVAMACGLDGGRERLLGQRARAGEQGCERHGGERSTSACARARRSRRLRSDSRARSAASARLPRCQVSTAAAASAIRSPVAWWMASCTLRALARSSCRPRRSQDRT